MQGVFGEIEAVKSEGRFYLNVIVRFCTLLLNEL